MLGRNERRKKEERMRKETGKEKMSEGVRIPVFLLKKAGISLVSRTTKMVTSNYLGNIAGWSIISY